MTGEANCPGVLRDVHPALIIPMVLLSPLIEARGVRMKMNWRWFKTHRPHLIEGDGIHHSRKVGWTGGVTVAEAAGLLVLILAGCQSVPEQRAVRFDPDETLVRGDAFDDAVQLWMKSQHIPGMAVAIEEDGRLNRARGYGWADLDGRVPVRPQTAFLVGSVSKLILATGVMILVEDGRLGLDDHVDKYIPAAPRSWKEITVRYLLSHTSGIPDLFNDPVVVNDVNLLGLLVSNHYLELEGDHTEKWLVSVLAQQPLRFPPGTRQAYSNSGYELLAIIIHRVTGKPYGSFLHERIFEPLDMTRTGVFGEKPPLTGVASGYVWHDNHLYRQSRAIPTVDGQGCGSGGIVTTVEDLAKFDAGLASGKLVSMPTLRQMRTADPLGRRERDSFGMGVKVGRDPTFRWVGLQGRWGAWGGYTSSYLTFLDQRLTMIFLTNGADADWGSMPQAVWRTYIPESRPTPATPRLHSSETDSHRRCSQVGVLPLEN